MKKVIPLFLALMTISSVYGTKSKMLTNQSVVIDDNLNDWVLVKEENGIKTYFKILLLDNEYYYSVKFENILNNDHSFSYEIVENEEVILKSNKKVNLNKGEKIEVFDPTMQKIVNGKVSVNDYEIFIK